MECRKCHKSFKAWVRINGELKNLGSRKYCLECSPYKLHNTRKVHLYDKVTSSEKFICAKCKIEKDRSEFYLRDGRVTYSYCKQCNKNNAYERSRNNKKMAVEYKGGKCIVCGYGKYMGALDFHHVEGDKDFGISRGGMKNFENIRKELDKCVLVCKNCHAEIEGGVANI